MGALAPFSPSSWFPQDDLLLKNAVEAGASLESLAKGAVEFSRRFTLEELKDRWYSLLYDPVVSREASLQMTKFENSSSIGGSKAQNSGTLKRKFETVRNCYYAMRKRICQDPFTILDPSAYLDSPINRDDCLGYSDEAFLADDYGLNDSNSELIRQSFPEPGLVNSSTDEGVYVQHDNIGGDNAYFDSNHYSANVEFSQPKEVQILDPFELYHPNDTDDQAGCSIFGTDGIVNSEMSDALPYCTPLPEESQFLASLPEMRNQDAFGFPDVAKQEYHIPSLSPIDNILEELSNSLMNPTGEEDDLLFMDIDEKDYIDNLSSHIFDSTPNHNNEPKAETTIEAASDIQQTLHDDIPSHDLRWEHSLISSPTRQTDAQSPPPELREGTILCVLNTEDTEVPCNDDVFLLYQMTPPAFSYSLEKPRHESCNPGPSFVNDVQACGESVVGVGKLKKSIPQIMKSSDENNDVKIVIPCEVKPAEEVVDDRLMNNNHGDIFTAMAPQTDLAQHTENGLEVIEEEIHLESDGEIPYISDIEQLIIDMDLTPDDKNSHPAFRHQNGDDASIKNIMRLEQASSSYMNRAIVNNNAFAVLYGRRIKYYIDKPEVLIGRTTDDHCIVDIDLRIEGKASKISRRQAIIKMDENGSFTMKNLGKGLIYINGNKLEYNKTANLPSNSLIDLRGMCFIFEKK